MQCRHCNTTLKNELIDLGAQPPSNSYLKLEDLDKPELYFPLKVYVCTNCFLVQTADYAEKEIFFNEDYAYFSSTSQSWLAHACDYVDRVIEKFAIRESSFVIEVASNDGYLLKNFVEKKIPCLGIEPTKSTASKSAKIGIDTLVEFYGSDTAHNVRKKYGGADLIVCNNVYAHVPDINDFTKALEVSLSEEGVVTIEFPHLLNLIKYCQFDTIYHEHFSYLSVATVENIFTKHNLRIFDVEELKTHGGSVRIYGCKQSGKFLRSSSVDNIIQREMSGGLFDMNTFENFSAHANNIKNQLLEFLLNAKKEGKIVCGYGAAAKGNTLLNFAGVKKDLLQFVVDGSPSKIGKYLPGSRVPILAPEKLQESKPDYVIIFPWNIASEITEKVRQELQCDAKIVTIIPDFNIS